MTHTQFLQQFGKLNPCHDHAGRFCSTPGSGVGFISPNVDEDLNFATAEQRLSGERHQAMKKEFAAIDDAVGIKTNSRSAIGDWSDGAEDSVVSTTDGPVDYETLKASTAVKGMVADQKAVIVFQNQKGGHDGVYSFHADGDMEETRLRLDAAGLQYRTLVPTKNGADVIIFDQGSEHRSTIAEKVGSYFGPNTSVTINQGRGEFIGADTRSEARTAYLSAAVPWNKSEAGGGRLNRWLGPDNLGGTQAKRLDLLSEIIPVDKRFRSGPSGVGVGGGIAVGAIAAAKLKERETLKAGSGVMIAWFPPPDLAAKMAIEGGEEADELHVTLAYFGKQVSSDAVQSIRKTLTDVAARSEPLTGTIAGWGMFPISDSTEGQNVAIRLVDVPRLESLRENILRRLAAQNIEPLRNHGYTPHVTAAYLEPGEPMPKLEGSFPITIGKLTLTVAQVKEHFELKTPTIELVWKPPASVLDIARSFEDQFPHVISDATHSKLLNSEPLTRADLEAMVEELESGISYRNALGGDAGLKWARKCLEKGEPDPPPFQVAKIVPSKRLVFGWANVTTVKGLPVVDRQGDVIKDDNLEEAVYDYVLKSRKGGEMHETIGVARLVESMMFTAEKQAALGIDLGQTGWWAGFYVDDDKTWEKVASGDYPMFSIGGRGIREEIKV